MPLQVVDGKERFAERQSQGFGADYADHQPADQARPGGGGEGIDIPQSQAGFFQRRFDQVVQMLDMGTRRDLRHYPAVNFMFLELIVNGIGKNALIGCDDANRGIIAAGLNPKHDLFFFCGHPVKTL